MAGCPASPSRISASAPTASSGAAGGNLGRTIGIAGEHPTGAEMAAALAGALGRDVRFRDISPADYRRLGFPGARDLGNMFQFQLEHNETFCRPRSLDESRALKPELQNFRQWLAGNKDRIPLE